MRGFGAAAAAGLRRLHWIDAETQALLDTLVESLPTARLLLLVNYRPEYQHGWGSKTYYTQLRLDPLPPVSAEVFLHALLGDDPSLAPLTRLLSARTGGNPSFGGERPHPGGDTGAGRGTRRLSSHATSTACRPPCRRCSPPVSIGCPRRRNASSRPPQSSAPVPFPLLQAIAALPEDELHRGLARLPGAAFLYETSLFPEPAYTFKHA